MSLVYERQDSFAAGMIDAEGNFLPADACEVILNMRTTPSGKLVRRGAHTTQGAASTLAAAKRGISADTAAGMQWLMFGGSSTPHFVYSANNGTSWTAVSSLAGAIAHGTTLAAGASSTVYLTAPSGGAGTSLYTWNGTAASAVAAAPTASNLIASFNDRLWIVPTDSDSLYASQVAAAGWDTNAGAFTLTIRPDEDGTPIVALLPLGDRLLVFRRRSISSVSGYGEQTLVAAEGGQGVSRSIGTIAGDTVVRIDGERAMWLSERGVELFDGGVVRLVSDAMRRWFDTVDWAAFTSTTVGAAYDRMRQEYRVYLPDGWEYVYSLRDGASYVHCVNTSSPVFELGGIGNTMQGLPKLTSFVQSFTPTYFAAFPTDGGESYPCYIYQGRLYKVEGLGDTTLGDTVFGLTERAVHYWVRTRPMTFGAPDQPKRVREVKPLVADLSAATVNVRAVADGAVGTAVALSYPDPGDAVRKPQAKLARVTGRGYTVQVDVYGTSAATLNGVSVKAEILTASAA